MISDPKWAKLVPPAETSIASTPGRMLSVASELERERKRRAFVEAQNERLRGVRKPRAPKPARKRSGREDTVAVVFPDVHGSGADQAALSALLGDMKRLDPDVVVGLGDLIDCGGFLAQHHVLGYVAQSTYSYEEDIAAANVFLDAVQGACPRAQLHLLEGNHVQRPERWAMTSALGRGVDAAFLRGQVAPERLLRLKERGAHYYKRSETYGGMPIQGAFRMGKVSFFHGPGNGNADPRRILSLFGTSVAYGHTHRIQSATIRTVGGGTIGAFNLGCLSRLQPLWQHGTPTSWAHAFGVFIMSRSGNFLPLTVPIVDGVSLLPKMMMK